MFGSEFSYFGFKDAINGPVLPPIGGGIDRRFQKRVDGTLIDSIAGRDATVLFPVSEFDGVDGYVVVPNSNTSPNIINTKVEIAEYNTIGNNTFFSSSDAAIGSLQFRVNASKVQVVYSAMAVIAAGTINVVAGDIIECEFNLTTNDYIIKVNDVVDVSGNSVNPFVVDDIRIGSRYPNNDIFDGGLSDMVITIDSRIISIPLPHLGYGYDANGDAVELTVSGGVSEGYDEDGSRHLVEKGAVERNPELAINNDFSNGLNDWLTFNGETELNGVVTTNGTAISPMRSSIPPLIPGVEYILKIRIDEFTSGIGYALYAGGSGSATQRFNTVGVFEGRAIAIGGNFEIETRGQVGKFSLVSITLATPNYIPNNNQGQPIVELVDGDTFISGTPFLNATPFYLDMSRPNGAEAEEVTNGGFDADTDWIKTGESTISGGTGNIISTTGLSSELQQVFLDIGKKYIYSVEIAKVINGGVNIYNGSPLRLVNNVGVYTGSFVATNDAIRFIRIGITDASIDNVSVKLAAPEILFFDKSDDTIWDDFVRASDFYDSNNPFLWHSTELTQQFIYDHIVNPNEYKWWVRLINNQYKDLFFYETALTGSDIDDARKYVRLSDV